MESRKKQKEPSPLLTEALNITIERIERTFDEDWLIINQKEADEEPYRKETSLHTERYHTFFEPASHNFCEICMCISGTMGLGMESQIHEAKEGQVGVILPGMMHSEVYVNKQDYLALWLVIDTSKARLHLSGCSEGRFYTSYMSILKQWYEYNLQLDIIKRAFQHQEKYSKTTVKACLLQIYILALRELLAQEHGSIRQDLWKESVTAEIKNFIDEKDLVNIKVHDISQEVCISESHMNNIFKSVTGMTINQYIEKQKVQKAKALLQNASLTIDYIAAELGYYDRYHFSKSFKKVTGCSPGLYRRTAK